MDYGQQLSAATHVLDGVHIWMAPWCTLCLLLSIGAPLIDLKSPSWRVLNAQNTMLFRNPSDTRREKRRETKSIV